MAAQRPRASRRDLPARDRARRDHVAGGRARRQAVQRTAPRATLEGQYVLKDVILVGAVLVVAAAVLRAPGDARDERAAS